MGFLKAQIKLVALVAVVIFAVVAVVSLTGTLFATHNIIDSVAEINTVYPNVDKNLKNVPLANETAKVAGEIDKATKSVGPAFTSVVQSVNGIQTSADGILQHGADINANAKAIGASVTSINAVVVTLGPIFGKVDNDVKEIRDSARGIGHKFDDILDTSHSIDDRVRGINDRADDVIDQAKKIRNDLDVVRNVALPGILQNSAAIANAPVLRIGALTTLVNALTALGLLPLPVSVPVIVPVGPEVQTLTSGNAPLLGDQDEEHSLSSLLGGHGGKHHSSGGPLRGGPFG